MNATHQNVSKDNMQHYFRSLTVFVHLQIAQSLDELNTDVVLAADK